MIIFTRYYSINTLRPRQNGSHFADAIFKGIFLNENTLIPITVSLKFIPKGPIHNIPVLFQIMPGADQATSHYLQQWWLMLPKHIRITQPRWVNSLNPVWSSICRAQSTDPEPVQHRLVRLHVGSIITLRVFNMRVHYSDYKSSLYF